VRPDPLDGPEGRVGELSRLPVNRKTGEERFHAERADLGFNLLDFWRWSVSDLVSNATRGRVAEYIVARALGISVHGVRSEWDAYDLKTPSGARVEVKSAAYIQSWHQAKLSSIRFLTRRTRAWDPDTNVLSKRAARHADVYVFALLAHTDKGSMDPLNVCQWRFFVLSREMLDDRTRSQHSITLKSLQALSAGPWAYGDLGGEIERAARLAEGASNKSLQPPPAEAAGAAERPSR